MEAEQDHSEVVATFCSITGASSAIAAHYLEAYGYDLDRSIDFYFANPPDAPGAAAGHHNDDSPEPPAAAAVDEGFVIEEDEQQDMGMGGLQGTGYGAAPGQAQFGGGTAAHGAGWQAQPHALGGLGAGQLHGEGAEEDLTGLDEDEQLQRALAASLNQGEAPPRRRQALATVRPSRVQEPADEDDEDEDLPDADAELREMARMREQSLAAHREAVGMMEGMASMTRNMVEGRGLGGGMPSMFPGLLGGLAGPSWAPPGLRHGGAGGAGLASSSAPGPGFGGGIDGSRNQGRGSHPDLGDLELPDGVDARDVEEARMLEAAMLGVQYEGHIPDFSARPARPSVPVDPSVREVRGLRHEQDQAYEESLAADRAKADSIAHAKAQAERAEREAREAEAAEARRLAEAEAALKATLERKKRGLGAEPASDDANSVNVMVRLPDGSRKGRRFRRSDPLQALFDFVDVQLQGESHLPGSYSLVVSYPRKVFADGTPGTLEDVGIAADSALFLEPNKSG